jgi:hypothetical protein
LQERQKTTRGAASGGSGIIVEANAASDDGRVIGAMSEAG